MTENEALKETQEEGINLGAGDYVDVEALKVAAKFLEEIQKYLALGTVEELSNAVKEEDVLKFYYCKSEDDYYIGKRIDTMYYAKYEKTGFAWFMSRYLPWGKHVIEPSTLWKEHTYPSEPKEIPFFEWLQGFLKKYCGGTVEELREAMEKQRSKKPKGKVTVVFDSGLWDVPCTIYYCPNCGVLIEKGEDAKYCCNCGQKFDWS